MKIRDNKLTFIIKNNTDQQIQMPLFTNGEDNNANATRCYFYDITAATFDGTPSTVQVKANGNDNFITYNLGILNNLTELLTALNALGFGTWYKNNAGTQIVICNNNLEFGDLMINTTNSTFSYIKSVGYNQTGFFTTFSTNTDMQVDWGDGNVDLFSGNSFYNPTHNYADNVERTIQVTIAIADRGNLTDLEFGFLSEVKSIGDLSLLTGCSTINTNFNNAAQPLISLGNLPPALTQLRAKRGQLSTLPDLPSTLTYLDVSENNLVSLPVLNTTSLDTINFSNNATLSGEVPQFPATMITVTCDNCPVSNFAAPIPNSIQYISASNCSFTIVPNPTSLLTFLFNNNSVPLLSYAFTPNIQTIELRNLGLSSIDTAAFPTSLQNLDVSDNALFQIFHSLPAGLISLKAANNVITSFSSLSGKPGLIEVQLQNNKLSTTAISNGLIDLDSNASSNGNAQFEGQTPAAPPNAGGTTAKANLIGRGWTVTTD